MVVRCKKTHSFTLVEILLAIVLLGLASASVGMNIIKGVRQEHFNGSIRRVVNKLQMAQDLMLISDGISVTVTFPKEKGEYLCELNFSGNLPAEQLYVFESQLNLKGVEKISFQSAEGKELVDEDLFLEFLSLGKKIPKGHLVLTGLKGNLRRYIPLPGYPAPIAISNKQLDFSYTAEELERESEDLYPTEVLEDQV